MADDNLCATARKEKASIIMITLACLLVIALVLIFVVLPSPNDIWVYLYQTMIFNTILMLIFFAFSTWFYMSNDKTSRKHARIFIVIILLIDSILLIVSASMVDLTYSYSVINSYFDSAEIFDASEQIMIMASVNLSRVVGVVVILIAIWMIFVKIKNK